MKAVALATILSAVVIGIAAVNVLARVEAAPAPLFEVGKTYSVVWECSPAVQAYIYSPEPRMAWVAPPDCYTERLKIIAVRKDGWMEAVDTSDNSVWFFNIARAIARRLYVPKADA